MFTASEQIRELRIEHITKRFPGVIACNDVSMSVNIGETLALVGENGAGKTSLMNILMGVYTADEGKIFINGEEVHFSSPADALACGIGMVHQHYTLVSDMTVTENVALGMQKLLKDAAVSKKSRFLRSIRTDMEAVRDRILEVAEEYSLSVDPDAYIWQLAVGEQQRVELIKTLCMGARFLILDEPTSALTPQETNDLILLLKRMASSIPIIFISHKLNEVKELCDKMLIMRKGKGVHYGTVKEHSAEGIAAMMTGHEVEFTVDRPAKNIGHEILTVKNLCVKSDRGYMALNKLDLTIRKGEIVGLAGVSGNGQKELAEALTGLRKIESGSVVFDGLDITNKSVSRIISAGMGYIPEDRNNEGIVPSMSIKENMVLKDISSDRYSRGMFIKNKAIDESTDLLMRRFDVRGSSSGVPGGSLSGGNIQKIILARELSRDPKLLIAVYPIRGLDMGAADFVHKQLLDMRDEGCAILLISEELDELINLSDRIAVIFKGSIQKVLERKQADVRELGILMAGVKANER